LDEKGSEIEAVLRMLALLPDLERITPHELEALKRSKQLAPTLLPLLNSLAEEREQLDLFEDGNLTRDLLASLDSLNEAHKERAKRILEEKFGISAKHYYEIGQLYDTFIDEISQTAIADRLSKEFNISLVEQLNDVVNCDPVKLLQMTAEVGDAAEKYRRENSGEYPRLIFESRRKLFTMSRINKVMEYYAGEREKSDTPVAKVWDSFQSIPHTTGVQRVLAPDGELLDVLTAHAPQELRDRYAQMAERGEAVLSDAQTDFTRDVYLSDGKLVAMRIFERPLKAKGSTIRKMMLGDESPTDVFARALIVDTADTDLLQRETRMVEVCKDVDAPVLETEAKEASDHAVVFRLLERFMEKAREVLGEGWTCAVGKYTPTPEGEDYQYWGKRAGTGGRIRLAKFVLMLTCRDGRRYKEEVQVFTPMPGGKSGYYFFQEKAEDDERYQVDRLLQQQGIRSLIEQMFPYVVYKPIPTVHRKR